MRFYALMITALAVILITIPLLGKKTVPVPGASGEKYVVSAPAPKTPADTSTQGQVQLVQPQEPEETTPAQSLALLPQVQEPLDDVFHILNETTGEIHEISVRDYVRGAVCSEMPSTFHSEALKAQAVSAHTYALNLKKQHAKNPVASLKGADFKADPSNWRGYVTEEQARERFGDQFEEHWGKICDAVDAVWNQLLIYDDEPIAAAYHAISNGTTEASENVWGRPLPYLQPVDSEGDLLAPGYEKQLVYPLEEMRSVLTDAFPDANLTGDSDSWITIYSRSPSGYVTAVEVGGTTVSGLDFRSALGLRSSDFTVQLQNGSFIVTTAGYGHGVGLSQYGADYMARQGSSYREILLHYYQGAQLVAVAK